MQSATTSLSTSVLLDALWARVSERGDFPLLSESLRATMTAMCDDELDLAGLVRVVLSDFALTQKVLRLANSAMYITFGGNITTVSRALTVLGMDAVGHLVVDLKLVDHFHQCAAQRIEAKLELNRVLLSGHIARKLTARTGLRESEEAVVCTLMRQVGRLLVVCHLDSEWRRIMQRATELGDDEAASADVLGVGFAAIGLEAASRWRLPDAIRAGMAGDELHATGDEADGAHVCWLRAVSLCSIELADALLMPPGPEYDARIAALAEHYGPVLGMGRHAFVELAERLVDDANDTTLRDIVELRASADELARAQAAPDACLEASLAELRALPSGHQPGPALSLASESLLANLGLTRTAMFVRDGTGTFAARVGFGPGIEDALPRLRFHERFEPDVFHLAISNSVGIYIENAREPKIRQRLPAWYRDAFDDARAFVLLPVRADTSTVALLYGAWTDASPPRKIAPTDMTLLNAFARELGRFFPA